MDNVGEKTHSILGASSSHRWLACPGSIRLSAGLPNPSSVYAQEGTAAHELAEKCLREDCDAASRIGTVITVDGHIYIVTEEMAASVQVYLDVVREAYADAGLNASMMIERKFDLSWLHPGLFGTNDAMVGQSFGLLQVFDYKHGAGVAVDVEKNSQLMYYGLGAIKGEAYEEVELVIVQPRAFHPGGPVRRYRMSVTDLMKWAFGVLIPGAKATEAPDAPLCTGHHCKFCLATAVCPAQKDQAYAVAKGAFADKKAPPPPESIPLPELKRILDASDMVEAWLKSCRAYAFGLLDTGRVLPEQLGYKIIAGRASRSWRDEGRAQETLATFLDEEAYSKKLITPAQAEKLLGG